MSLDPERARSVCDFLAAAGALKDQLRSASTPAGAPESVAAHSWSLALLAVTLADDLDGIDLGRLLSLIAVHDLGEAISGDVPAIHRDPRHDKTGQERADMAALTKGLPNDVRSRILGLWEEYEAAETPEAVIAKGLDKCETMLAHAAGSNPPDFDYGWNLGYGVEETARTPLLRSLREVVDARTRARIEEVPPRP